MPENPYQPPKAAPPPAESMYPPGVPSLWFVGAVTLVPMLAAIAIFALVKLLLS